MATASKKNPPTAPPPRKISDPARPDKQGPTSRDPWILRAFDATYRFLASLKLAVFCILTLALVLAGATIFESFTTPAASRLYIYQNPLFAILLTFLGTNVFCAATIRFPWKKRQIGFVVTHIGLLVILAGAFVSLKGAEEGQLGMAEGATSSEIERDQQQIKIQKIEAARDEPDGFKVVKSYALPFAPGTFAWKSQEVARLAKTPEYQRQAFLLRCLLWTSILTLLAVVALVVVSRKSLNRWIAVPLIGGLLVLVGYVGIYNMLTPSGPRMDVLSNKGDPFTFVVRDYLDSSNYFQKKTIAEPDREGSRLARLALLAQPPNAKTATDGFGGEGWFEANDANFGRQSRDAGQALVSVQSVGGKRTDEVVEDFLHPPANPMTDRVARFFYNDKAGKRRSFDWVLTEKLVDQSTTLPDSDISVKLQTLKDISLMSAETPQATQLRQALGERAAHAAVFLVRRGQGPESSYFAIASLPTFQNSAADDTPEELVRISYFHPPAIQKDAGMASRLGTMEVMATEDGRYFYRAFGRTGLRGADKIEIGKPVKIFGGDKMPMQISLELAEVVPKGTIREIYPELKLPWEDREKRVPAIEGELTIDGVTKKLSLVSSLPIRGQVWGDIIRFPSGFYRASFDHDRTSVPFRLDLVKFTPGKDPGSGSPATFTSYVELSDPELGLKNEPRIITMNEPLTHRGWTFYQSQYDRTADPQTGQKDGLYLSIFQVHYDPAWKIIYSGCALVVSGIFLQFYMRAGVFTDGGALERARAEARKRKKSGLPAAELVHTEPEPIENL